MYLNLFFKFKFYFFKKIYTKLKKCGLIGTCISMDNMERIIAQPMFYTSC